MFHFQKSITGVMDIDKLWTMYSDVCNWCRWDKNVKSVRLFGDFKVGSHGVMQRKEGLELPFRIEECTEKQSFIVSSALGPINVTFGHSLKRTDKDITITHTITVTGDNEVQTNSIGGNLAAELPDSLESLFAVSV